MLYNKSGVHVFNERDLNTVLESKIKKMEGEIAKDIELKSLKDEANYIKSKVKKYEIQPLEFLPDALSVSKTDEMIPSKLFPFNFAVHDGESYSKQVLSFHLPFKGNPDLLRCIPSTRILWTEEVLLKDNEIIFDMINFSNSAEEVKNVKDNIIDSLKKQSSNVNSQVIQYNTNLENKIKEAIKFAKEKLYADSKFLEELGVPLKK